MKPTVTLNVTLPPPCFTHATAFPAVFCSVRVVTLQNGGNVSGGGGGGVWGVNTYTSHCIKALKQEQFF